MGWGGGRACVCVWGGGPAARRPPVLRARHRRLLTGGPGTRGGRGRGTRSPLGPAQAPAAAQTAHLHFLNEPLDGWKQRRLPGPAATLAETEPHRPRGDRDGEVPAAGCRSGGGPRRQQPAELSAQRRVTGSGGGERAAVAAPSPASVRRSRGASPVTGRAPLPPPPQRCLLPPRSPACAKGASELLAINNYKTYPHLPSLPGKTINNALK